MGSGGRAKVAMMPLHLSLVQRLQTKRERERERDLINVLGYDDSVNKRGRKR